MSVTSDMKQRIIGVVTLLVIFTILGALLVFERPRDSDLTSYEAQTQRVFKDAKSQFEHIRNVTLSSNIKLFVYTKQQAIDRWGGDNFDLNTVSGLRRENIYKSLFLMSENDSLNGAAAEWISGWTAASVNNEIYVIYENFWPWDLPEAEAVLIHELTHIWQPSLPAPSSYDMDIAYSALFEGDASYMGDYYRALYSSTMYSSDSGTKNVDYRGEWVLRSFLHVTQRNTVYHSDSGAMTELNLFPYRMGKAFVSAIVDEGNWERLNQCYTSIYVPITTAQIIHPDKYFSGETSETALVSISSVDDNWTIIPSSYGYTSDSYGEYFIYVMLNRWLNDNQAQEASTGWSNDSFTYYERNNDFLFTWNITWDSIHDASEFNQAFKDMLSYAQTSPQDDNTWYANGRYLTLTWNPNTNTTLILCSTNQIS